MKVTSEVLGALVPYLEPMASLDEVRVRLERAFATDAAPSGRVYSDRDLLSLFRMLLRQQIQDERINNITELHGLLAHVDEALA